MDEPDRAASGPPSRREVLASLGFLALTFASMVGFSVEGVVWGGDVKGALQFAVSLLSILLAHELGHWVVARRHGFALSLPWFLPFPSLFGTMGAVIRLKSPPQSRTALLEMAAAGPVAGAVVAFSLLFLALPWTSGIYVPKPGEAYTVFADPLVVKLLGTLRLGAPPDRLAELHPVALAGWCGCMLTGINLLPLGQLDGGHIVNAMAPRWAGRVGWAGLLACAAGGFAWPGWWVWGALLLVSGARQSLPVPEAPPPSVRAVLLAAAAAALFILTFMPTPIVQETAPVLPSAPSP